ncbi:prevent-host-death family protein (plasmid) [Mycolicibacterium chubuense NBB4]|uniref:Prevent-host-death family protein n=2 Tax=Mycolicibacterium chubuense TaxID=1800 RepID=I4BSY8_MYCCN|nr:prevent-host-death family protein [Mycolicibacterium chubuense NBB4]
MPCHCRFFLAADRAPESHNDWTTTTGSPHLAQWAFLTTYYHERGRASTRHVDSKLTYGHYIAMAEAIGLGQLRSDTCGYLERVTFGESLDIIRRGQLVARIEPVTAVPDVPSDGKPVGLNQASDRTVSLDDLRTRAGRCFDRVAAGQSLAIVWRGRSVARIVAVAASAEASCNPTKCESRDAGGRIGLTELRTRGGHYFKRVAAGETVEVSRRGRLVARIVTATDDLFEPS